MTGHEQLTLEQENTLLKQNIHQLQESLQSSQQDLAFLKTQNDSLIASNNALTEQIKMLTKEIGDIKSHFESHSQSIVASPQSQAKALKRPTLSDSDDTMKKFKNLSWSEASTEVPPHNSNDGEPMQEDRNQSNQHNLTSTNDNANLDNNTSNTIGFRTVSYKTKSNQKQSTKSLKSNTKMEKVIKPAPIQVNTGTNGYSALHSALNRTLGNGKFVANNMMANQAVRIQPIDIESGKIITDFLVSHGYEFHSFKNKAERGKCFILRGLNDSFTGDDILKALVQAGFPTETTINQHITGFQKAHPEIKHNLLYRIVTPSSFDERTISEIDALFDLKVKFERMKGNKIIQCKRCQEYFHTASSCHHPFRCVKCKDTHEIGECPRDANPNLPIRCVNCDGAHSANNHKECKYFIEKIAPVLNKKRGKNIQKPMSNTQTLTQRSKLTAASTPTNPKTSSNESNFANAVKGVAAQKATNIQKNNVSAKPGLSLEEKFDKLFEAQLAFQNQMVQMIGNLNRAMAPSGPRRY